MPINLPHMLAMTNTDGGQATISEQGSGFGDAARRAKRNREEIESKTMAQIAECVSPTVWKD